jgi:hypothetical protein
MTSLDGPLRFSKGLVLDGWRRPFSTAEYAADVSASSKGHTMKPNAYWPTCAVLLGLLAGPALAGPDIDLDHPQRTAQLESTPLDVTTLGERGVECRRWLATVITDAATDYRVERALTRLRCDALATDKAALRHKYAQSPRVLQSIDAGP